LDCQDDLPATDVAGPFAGITVTGGVIPMLSHAGPLAACAACSVINRGACMIIRDTSSAKVADVTILAQFMLSAMSEPGMCKLLVCSDHRPVLPFARSSLSEPI
jgi:hypothetical protein